MKPTGHTDDPGAPAGEGDGGGGAEPEALDDLVVGQHVLPLCLLLCLQKGVRLRGPIFMS
jgi:hypothetical protein